MPGSQRKASALRELRSCDLALGSRWREPKIGRPWEWWSCPAPIVTLKFRPPTNSGHPTPGSLLHGHEVGRLGPVDRISTTVAVSTQGSQHQFERTTKGKEFRLRPQLKLLGFCCQYIWTKTWKYPPHYPYPVFWSMNGFSNFSIRVESRWSLDCHEDSFVCSEAIRRHERATSVSRERGGRNEGKRKDL